MKNISRDFLVIVGVTALAVVFAYPSIYIRITESHLAPYIEAICAGGAILCAAFLILWACDAIQCDVSQMLAIIIVALIAVLPEYAVDMYFTWMAGKHPESEYSQYAIANMTGANRLLIGVGWAIISIIVWIKKRQAVTLSHDRKWEIWFLIIASLVALSVVAVGKLTLIHGAAFIAIFLIYTAVAGSRPVCEPELLGPGKYLAELGKVRRRFWTIVLFLFSAVIILLNAEPFSEGLVKTGKLFHINEFLLVQWLAPLASEAPEFTVAILLALRGQGGVAFGALLSSKLNQWTLLVGMIPGVYAISSSSLHPIPMGHFQINEIFLTAAQSVLATLMLLDLSFSMIEGLGLFLLFFLQFALPSIFSAFHPGGLAVATEHGHRILSWAYIALSIIPGTKQILSLKKLTLVSAQKVKEVKDNPTRTIQKP